MSSSESKPEVGKKSRKSKVLIDVPENESENSPETGETGGSGSMGSSVSRLRKVRSLGSGFGPDDETMSVQFSSGDVDEADDPEDLEIFDDRAFEQLEPIYTWVLEKSSSSCGSDVNITVLAEQFKILWEAIQNSHKNETLLVRADREISKKLSDTMAKTRNLIKIVEDDPKVTRILASKLETAWNLTDTGEQDEKKNMARINELKDDVYNLNRNIEIASKIEGQEAIHDLIQVKKELETERNQVQSECEKLRSELNVIYGKRQSIFLSKQANQEKMKMLENDLEIQKQAQDREMRRKVQAESKLSEILQLISIKESEIKEMEEKIKTTEGKFENLEKNLKDRQIINEADVRDSQISHSRIEKLRVEFEKKLIDIEKLTMELHRRHHELKAREEEVANLQREITITTRERSLNLKKVVSGKVDLAHMEREREKLKKAIGILEGELESEQKRISKHKRQLDGLDKERFFLSRNFHRANNVLNEQTDLGLTHETALSNINRDLRNYQEEMDKQRDTIVRLEKERDYYSHEATKLASHVGLRLEEIKKLDIMIFEYRKRLSGMENQLKKQQQIAENAMYDKRMFSRQLRDSLRIIMENNTKIRHNLHRTNAVKMTIAEKETEVQMQTKAYERLLKEAEFFKKESDRMKKIALDLERQTEALELERTTLSCGVAELEGEIGKQNFYANSAESREKAYERKFMEKEKELKNSWENWRNFHSEVRIAMHHIRNLVVESRDIRCDIVDVTKNKIEKGLELGLSPKNIRTLTAEASYIENLISKEKVKINALEDQMTHPMNVHRWRILETGDPEAFEFMKKINMLTKRLVHVNNQLAKKNDQIENKQTLYIEVREVLKNSPGLESPEEVTYLQHLLSAKCRQLGALKGEHESANSQIDYYKDETSQMANRLMDIKCSYFDQMQGQICQEGKNHWMKPQITARKSITSRSKCLTIVPKTLQNFDKPRKDFQKGQGDCMETDCLKSAQKLVQESIEKASNQCQTLDFSQNPQDCLKSAQKLVQESFDKASTQCQHSNFPPNSQEFQDCLNSAEKLVQESIEKASNQCQTLDFSQDPQEFQNCLNSAQNLVQESIEKAGTQCQNSNFPPNSQGQNLMSRYCSEEPSTTTTQRSPEPQQNLKNLGRSGETRGFSCRLLGGENIYYSFGEENEAEEGEENEVVENVDFEDRNQNPESDLE